VTEKKIKSILVFLGTRPEAIKMSPVINALRAKGFHVIIGLSGQHNEMVNDQLKLFKISADFSLEIQDKVKNTEDVVSLCLPQLCQRLKILKPDLILVHGDTSTTLAGALSGFYEKIPVGHVEAGLRSHNYLHPWPEEMNRRLTASLSLWHFAPTASSKHNLIKEGIDPNLILITGNTVIDALYMMNSMNEKNPDLKEKFQFLDSSKKWILVTGHRRENFGLGLKQFMQALLRLSQRPDVEIIFPVHPNPQVRASFADLIQPGCPIHLIQPLAYSEMVWLLSRSRLVITDSGGIQEEAPSFKVPVVVTRETTERTETVSQGWAKLVGTDSNKIVDASNEYLDSTVLREFLKNQNNPYGDGTAAVQIANHIEQFSL
jgi:UDP-N-acetylglucosamine 2-epimerase (non-hydrolysing)